jgi:hypothetical protein
VALRATEEAGLMNGAQTHDTSVGAERPAPESVS